MKSKVICKYTEKKELNYCIYKHTYIKKNNYEIKILTNCILELGDIIKGIYGHDYELKGRFKQKKSKGSWENGYITIGIFDNITI